METQRASKRSPEEHLALKRAYARYYYILNKKTIAQHRSVQSICEICYGTYTPTHKAVHARTKRHLRALAVRAAQNPASDEAQEPSSEDSTRQTPDPVGS